MISTIERRYTLDEYRAIEEKAEDAANTEMEKLYLCLEEQSNTAALVGIF
jgi:hypothetical protein